MTSPIVNITDHITQALDNLNPRWRADPLFRDLVSVLVKPLQELDDTIFDCIVDRQLDTAVGANLDQYGALLNTPRDGRSDVSYRRLLQVGIASNREAGTPNAIINAAAVLLESLTVGVRYYLVPPAGYRLEFSPDIPVTADDIADAVVFLLQLTPAGVSIEQITERASAPTFRLDKGTPNGLDSGKLSKVVFP